MIAERRVVLLGWELGGGLGHARRLLRVAGELKRRGLAPIVAASQLWVLAQEYRRAGIPLIQAPVTRRSPPPGRAFEARGYADIMAACGYQRIETLAPTVAGWDALIDAARPRGIIADYSPMLALAAFGRVPLITVGSGFAVPPPQLSAMPLLRAEGTAMLDEAGMLRNAAAVQQRRGLAAPESIPGLVGGEVHVVCTYPEIDVYAALRASPATGPVTPPLEPLPAAERPALFAYLEAECRWIGDLLSLLLGAGVPLEVFIRNATAPQRAALRARGVRVHDEPPPLADALRRASVIAHHGGIGTMEAALALGRVQLIAPLQLEQMANTRKLLALGAAAAVLPERAAQNREVVAGVIGSQQAAARAAEIAARIAARGPPSSLERIAQACEMLARR